MQEDKKIPTLSHLTIMMGPHGLYQHATIVEPLLFEGYCTDDNARAVQMLIRLMPLVPSDELPTVQTFLKRCWKFLREAQIRPGYFYNFRSATGEWLPQGVEESEDMYARIIRALANVLVSSYCVECHSESSRMLIPLLERASEMQAPRFWAELLVALSGLPASMKNENTVRNLTKQGQNILAGIWRNNATKQWPWFEPNMTYANALLPHGLLAALGTGSDTAMEEILHASAAFLINTTITDGVFTPIGNKAWYSRGGKPSNYDQQAIEASTMLDFLIEYQAKYPNLVSYVNGVAPYLWFFGKNTNSVVMVDEKIGSCFDGLADTGANQNRGAESMLAYQWAEIRMREASPDIQQFAADQKALTAS